MATVELTKDNFKDVALEGAGVTIVDFWAGWCGPCLGFAPVFDRVSEDYPGVVFGKVDTEAEPELSQLFRIMSIPTLMVFRDEVLVYNQPGALPEPSLRQLVEQVLALDMDEVRRQTARTGD